MSSQQDSKEELAGAGKTAKKQVHYLHPLSPSSTSSSSYNAGSSAVSSSDWYDNHSMLDECVPPAYPPVPLPRLLQSRPVGTDQLRHFARTPHSTQFRLLTHPCFMSHFSLDRQLIGHQGCVNRLAWNTSGSLLASGSDDCCVRIWDWRSTSRRCVVNLDTGHRSNIFAVGFLSHDDLVVSAGADCEVRLTTIETQEKKSTFCCSQDRVKELCVDPSNDSVFFTAGEDGVCRQYDIREARTCTESLQRNITRRWSRRGITPAEQRWCPHALIFDPSMGLKCVDVNPTQPHYILLSAVDQYIRVYDRRMIPRPSVSPSPSSSSPGCVSRHAAAHLRSKHHSTFSQWDETGSQIIASYSGEQVYVYDFWQHDHDEDKGSRCMRYSTDIHKHVEEKEREKKEDIVLHEDEHKEHRDTDSQWARVAHPTNEPFSQISQHPFDLDRAFPSLVSHSASSFSPHPHSSSSSSSSSARVSPASGLLNSAKSDQWMPPDVTRFKDLGNNAFRDRDYSTAISYYNEAVLCASQHGLSLSVLYSNRAIAYLRRKFSGDANIALADALLAFELDPHNYKAGHRAALAHKELHHYRRGIQLCQQLLLLMNNDSTVEQKHRDEVQHLREELIELKHKRAKKSSATNHHSASYRSQRNQSVVNEERTARREEKEARKRKEEERKERRDKREKSLAASSSTTGATASTASGSTAASSVSLPVTCSSPAVEVKEDRKRKKMKNDSLLSDDTTMETEVTSEENEEKKKRRVAKKEKDKEKHRDRERRKSIEEERDTEMSEAEHRQPEVHTDTPTLATTAATATTTTVEMDEGTKEKEKEEQADHADTDTEDEEDEEEEEEEEEKEAEEDGHSEAADEEGEEDGGEDEEKVYTASISISPDPFQTSASESSDESCSEDSVSSADESSTGRKKEENMEDTNTTDKDKGKIRAKRSIHAHPHTHTHVHTMLHGHPHPHSHAHSNSARRALDTEHETSDSDHIQTRTTTQAITQIEDAAVHKEGEGQAVATPSIAALPPPSPKKQQHKTNRSHPIRSASAAPSPLLRTRRSFLQRYVGHSNVQTDIKEATFWGQFILSGSDDGHLWIWERRTGRLCSVIEASQEVVNCARGHPHLTEIVTSGIDSEIAVWTAKKRGTITKLSTATGASNWDVTADETERRVANDTRSNSLDAAALKEIIEENQKKNAVIDQEVLVPEFDLHMLLRHLHSTAGFVFRMQQEDEPEGGDRAAHNTAHRDRPRER